MSSSVPPASPGKSNPPRTAWGPVLAGVAALLTAIGGMAAGVQQGWVTAPVDLAPVRDDIKALRQELHARDAQRATRDAEADLVRRRVGELERDMYANLEEHRAFRDGLAALQTRD